MINRVLSQRSVQIWRVHIKQALELVRKAHREALEESGLEVKELEKAARNLYDALYHSS